LPPVLYSSSGRIRVITLNRPEARNAIDRETALGLEAAVDRLEADPEAWVGVLCANTAEQVHPVFCAGADLEVIKETGSATSLDTERGGFGGFMFRDRVKPIVVAVDGLATAGGLEIVLAADFVVATTRSPFGLAEVRRNLIAAAGGLFRLPRAIGRAAAMDAILTGEPIAARRAFDLGLVSRLIKPGDALDEPLASEDAGEGLLAFAEKRPPSGKDGDANERRCTLSADGQNRREWRFPPQREVEGASGHDRRHVGAGLRARRLPRDRHRGAL
jgi:enoyl-CoA hydratase